MSASREAIISRSFSATRAVMSAFIRKSEKLSARGSYGRSLRRGNRAAFRLGDRKEVYRLGKRSDGRRAPEFRLHEIIYRHTGKNCVLHVRTPYVMAASMEGKTLKGYLDDAVQIVGLTLCCIPDREFTGRQAKRLEAALLGRSAVLLKDNGAICVGKTPDDARAVAAVLEKGCQAALLAERTEGVKPVSLAHAWLERMIYQRKYSKLK